MYNLKDRTQMKTAIRKWGNSLGIRIPKAITIENNLEEGSEVDIVSEGGLIVLKPTKRKRYNLKTLIEGINKSNLHGEISTGDSMGEEIW